MSDELERRCCVRGYHVYREVWEAAVGEILVCEREPDNVSDRYAVAVKREGTVVGHLPRKISRLCSLFLRQGGTVSCTVIGRRRYSADIPQGGLEVPCSLIFKATPKLLLKLKKMFKINGN